ncbi:hypothetical protein [Anabaenopsis arnoldii]|uniref:hypothetical protein n=1 Tax=Anabaenopsis arnoldii TaxID=2152938 RepID=UPI00232BF88F|nr:hypothetical protein [Anabaenopsis arnoldii]
MPTDFYCVEYSRLPIIAMLVDRGCSDTDGGEVYPTYSIKFMGANKIFCSFPPYPVIWLPALVHRGVVNSCVTECDRLPDGSPEASCCFS